MGQPLTLDEVRVAPEDAAQVIYDLRRRIRSLAVALQTHRADMHSTSSRPCSTCRTSADALTEVGVTPFVEGTGMDRMAAIAAAQQATGGSNGTS